MTYVYNLLSELYLILLSMIIFCKFRKPTSCVCLMRGTLNGHLFDVPFIQCFNLKYDHSCSRATSLTMPSSNNTKMERKDCHAFSTFLTPIVS